VSLLLDICGRRNVNIFKFSIYIYIANFIRCKFHSHTPIVPVRIIITDNLEAIANSCNNF
jgi:hypothetical protein